MTASAPELGFKIYFRFVTMVCFAHLFTYIIALDAGSTCVPIVAQRYPILYLGI